MHIAIQRETFSDCVPSCDLLVEPRTADARPAITRTGAPGMVVGQFIFFDRVARLELAQIMISNYSVTTLVVGGLHKMRPDVSEAI